MEKPAKPEIPALFFALFAALHLVAFSCCISAEFRKAQEKDLTVEGTLCSLPRKPAFGLGLAALVCLSLAQIFGTSLAVVWLRLPKVTHRYPIVSLAVSWVSFGVASVLLGAGTSMNNEQKYGRGWLDGRCYLVRRGVYASAGLLAVLCAAPLVRFVVPTVGFRRPPTVPDEIVSSSF
ncbi:chitin synthase, putative (DUF1218) [Wolffia australiana]